MFSLSLSHVSDLLRNFYRLTVSTFSSSITKRLNGPSTWAVYIEEERRGKRENEALAPTVERSSSKCKNDGSSIHNKGQWEVLLVL